MRGPENLIKGNRVHHNEDSGIQVFSGDNRTRIINNLVYANKGFTTTVQTNCTHPAGGNTRGWMTGDHGIDASGVTGGQIVGNTVYGSAVSCPNGAGRSVRCPRNDGNIRVDTSSRLGTTLDFDLLYLSSAGPLAIWGTTSYSTLAAFRTASGREARGLQGNPRFNNPAIGLFTLAAGCRSSSARARWSSRSRWPENPSPGHRVGCAGDQLGRRRRPRRARLPAGSAQRR